MRHGRYIVFTGLFITIVLAVFVVYKPLFLTLMDNKIYDVLLMAMDDSGRGFPVIVDIDEESLSKYGQWPWPRYKIAKLLESILALGPVGVGLDMFFPEPDRTSLSVVKEEILKNLGVDVHISGVPEGYEDNDTLLAVALRRGPFVPGYQFMFENSDGKGCILHPLQVVWVSETADNELLKASGVLCNLKKLGESVQVSGFINSTTDEDGVVRRVPLIISYNGQIYPNLSLATLLLAISEKQIFLHTISGAIDSIQIADTHIPLDDKGNMLVRYYKRDEYFERVSAASVMSGRVLPEKLSGKIVLVGTSAAGLKDIRVTPLNPKSSGVEIHATVIENILKNDYLTMPSWAKGVEFLIVLLVGVVSSFIIYRFHALMGALVVLFFVFLCFVGSLKLIQTSGVYISGLYPMLTLLCNYTVLTLLKYRREEKRLLNSTKELAITQEATIDVIASAIESRDNQTGGHINRTKEYVKVLALHLKKQGKFNTELDDEAIGLMYRCAPVHDVGKIGVPDRVLLKADKLTEEEFAQMKKHTVYGKEIIQTAIAKLGSVKYLKISEEMAYTHHEKWDSSGYPRGIVGKDIPLSGRIMAVADVYDALISRRVYKPGLSHEKAVSIIREGRGRHFDPEVVDAFLEIEERFRLIAIEFTDSIEDKALLAVIKKDD
ncbi:MAG: CHASE2 domain-containing protein [Candidatus Magnetoovum sp. WYHC-5]|nr:CHASE2 domain-containing protein [Candidatus Magnetoovum sp. WYHC-5]